MTSKRYQIVVYGLGFTGQLVATYLHEHYPALRWAVAGRNPAKVHATLQQLGLDNVDVIVADSADEPSLSAMVQQTQLVISLVSRSPARLLDCRPRLRHRSRGAHRSGLT